MLEIKNASINYGMGEIVQNISFQVEPGEKLVLLGRNGVGKTTTLKGMIGLLPMAKGDILLDGKNITKLPEYKRAEDIGRVFQDPLKGTAFDMSIEENLAIAYYKNRSRGLQPGLTGKDRQLFRERLAMLDMGLEDKMTQKVKLLSGGQRQALTLFMAVIAEPKLLLLDEHTAALDPAAAATVLALTNRFASRSGMCTLMITHNMKDALTYGNRTILMKSGRILMDISGAEREAMTVETLIEKFSIDSDRMLLKD